MPSKLTSYITASFCFMFWSFMAVHHAHMKTPVEGRGLASSKSLEKPFYNSSYKL